MNRRGASIAVMACALLIPGVAGCGDEDKRYSDDKIVKRLDLEKSEAGFAIDGDPFCEVDKKLLNNATEVNRAADKDELGLVIASRERNVGVLGIPPFTPDCADEAKRKLNKLDPAEE